jgi:hypothetical protein
VIQVKTVEAPKVDEPENKPIISRVMHPLMVIHKRLRMALLIIYGVMP